MKEKPLEIDFYWTKEKIVIERNPEEQTFTVSLPQHCSVSIHRTEENVDVMVGVGGGIKKGKTLRVPKNLKILKLMIAIGDEK